MAADRGDNEPRALPGSDALLIRLLNILWRYKLLILLATAAGWGAGMLYGVVTKPLYRASLQVRPGVTAYTPVGEPVREWRIKDIVTWFRKRLYWQTMLEQPEWRARGFPPIIRAEFIPRAPQDLQGGNIVILETLAPDPEEAKAILDAAFTAFVAQAATDTLFNSIQLTRDGLLVRLDKVTADLSQVAADSLRLELSITEAREKLNAIKLEEGRLDQEIRKLEAAIRLRERGLTTSEAEQQQALANLKAAQALRERAQAAGGLSAAQSESLLVDLSRDPATRWVLATADGGRLREAGELLMQTQALGRALYRVQARADSLRYFKDVELASLAELQLQRTVGIAKQRFDIELAIMGLEVQRDRDLAHKRQQFRLDLASLQNQLDALSPLERISRTTATNKPVRPRKARAVGILTVLAFGGSLFLAVAIDYLSRHRSEIFTQLRR